MRQRLGVPARAVQCPRQRVVGVDVLPPAELRLRRGERRRRVPVVGGEQRDGRGRRSPRSPRTAARTVPRSSNCWSASASRPGTPGTRRTRRGAPAAVWPPRPPGRSPRPPSSPPAARTRAWPSSRPGRPAPPRDRRRTGRRPPRGRPWRRPVRPGRSGRRPPPPHRRWSPAPAPAPTGHRRVAVQLRVVGRPGERGQPRLQLEHPLQRRGRPGVVPELGPRIGQHAPRRRAVRVDRQRLPGEVRRRAKSCRALASAPCPVSAASLPSGRRSSDRPGRPRPCRSTTGPRSPVPARRRPRRAAPTWVSPGTSASRCWAASIEAASGSTAGTASCWRAAADPPPRCRAGRRDHEEHEPDDHRAHRGPRAHVSPPTGRAPVARTPATGGTAPSRVRRGRAGWGSRELLASDARREGGSVGCGGRPHPTARERSALPSGEDPPAPRLPAPDQRGHPGPDEQDRGRAGDCRDERVNRPPVRLRRARRRRARPRPPGSGSPPRVFGAADVGERRR